MKTHAWSDDWNPKSAAHIFLTHRDLRGVLASYQRVGWAFDITPAYVIDHMRWRVHCHAPSPHVQALVALQNVTHQMIPPAATLCTGGASIHSLLPRLLHMAKGAASLQHEGMLPWLLCLADSTTISASLGILGRPRSLQC